MRQISHLAVPAVVVLACSLAGCFSVPSRPSYTQADTYTPQIKTLAVLPLVVGNEKGEVRRRLIMDLHGFSSYFEEAFFPAFEQEISLAGDLALKLPGKDFDLSVVSPTGSAELEQARQDLNVDAVLAVSLVMYDEVTPAGMGAREAGAILDTLLFGSRYEGADDPVAGFVVHYSYLGVEDVKDPVVFHFIGKSFPTIEEQRRYFVGELVKFIDFRCPLSTDYRRPND